MNSQKQKGFTLVEIILFFALSGTFLMIAFVGIRGRTEALQFTDAMRSMQNYIVSEQNKVTNGVNSSSLSACDGITPTGEKEDCLLVGRIITFTDSSAEAKSNVMYGGVPTSYDLAYADSDFDRLKLTKPRADNSTGDYSIDWGVKFNKNNSSDINGSKVVGIGWLRSPGSNRVLPIVINENTQSHIDSDNFIDDTGNYEIDTSVADDTRLCFDTEAGRIASVGIDIHGEIALLFDDEDCR